MVNKIRGAAFLLSLLVTGCGPSDPHLDAATAHLSANLDGGDVEVVQWWPAKPMPEARQAAIDARKAEAERVRREIAEVEPTEANRTLIDIKGDILRTALSDAAKAEGAPVPIAGRLKYRTTTRAGGKVLVDEVFVFNEDGGVADRAAAADDPKLGPIWAARDKLWP